MYYSNAATTSAATTTGVWDSNYILVDHLNSDPGGTAPQSLNSVTNTAIGTTSSVSTTTGKAGDGYDMNGTSAFVGWATSTFPVLDNGTVEVWFDPDTLTSDRYLFSNVKAGATVQGEWRAYIDSANSFKIKYMIECGATQNIVLSDAAASTTAGWAHAAMVWTDTGGNGNQKLYVNSVQQAQTGNTACGMETNDNYALGKNNGLNNSFFDGQFDELRISNIARSADWISATYASIQDTLVGYGTVAGLPGAPTNLSAIPYDSKVRLSWTAPSGTMTDYVVEYKLTSNSSWTTFSDGVSASTSAVITGLTNGSSYDLRVAAVNAQGQGTSSYAISSTPASVIDFVSPMITNGSATSSATITGFASTTLSTSSSSPSYFTFRLERNDGSLVASATTSTRYGNYNISQLATTTNKADIGALYSITGDLSGIVYVPTTDTLFTIHNNQNKIHEIRRDGSNVRTITCSACNDAEDITLVSSVASSTAGGYDHTFLISTEDVSLSSHQVFQVVIHSTGAATVDRTNYYSTGISSGPAANSGLEGVAYNSNNGYFFAAAEGQESSSGVPGIPKIYEVVPKNISTHAASSTQICTNIDFAALTLTDSSLFPASPGYSDISGLYFEPSNNHLYVLSHLADKMFELDVTSTSSCQVLRNKRVHTRVDNGANFLYEMPEGITWDNTGDYIYVGTEAAYLSAWRTTAYNVRSTFSGLSDGYYNMYVSVTDTNGVTSTSSARSFTVTSDTTGPSINSVTATPSETTATITWTTNEAASSSVAYGLTASYGTVSTSTNTTLNHSVTLTGLTANTTYHYQVLGRDAWGNVTTTSDATFTTSATPAAAVAATPNNIGIGVLTSSSGGSAGFGAFGAFPQANNQGNNPNNPQVPQNAPQAQLPALKSPGALQQGIINNDIRIIQKILNKDNDTKVAKKGIGSPGNETNYFGPATRQAIQKFQLKHGIVKNAKDPGFGIIGPKTKAKLNELR